MSIKLHIYLSSLTYISLDVTANAGFFKSKHPLYLFTDGCHIFCTMYSAHKFFFFRFLYDNAFHFFSVNGCFILRDVKKIKFETQAYNKDVEQKV